MTGNDTPTQRERVVCQVWRYAQHREAGARCAPGARWARFLFPTRPARTDSTCGGVGEGSFQRNSRLMASEAKPGRGARLMRAQPAEGMAACRVATESREREKIP